MNKRFWIPLLMALGTMILLYIIGFVANIELLKIKISFSSSEISLIPIAIGMLTGFISERMIKTKTS